MNFQKIKLEFFYLRKSFFTYHRAWLYLINKYIYLPKILKRQRVFDKPINNDDLSFHILTCQRDLGMTIVALGSYFKVATIVGQIYFHDDGSLNKKDRRLLLNFFPSAKIVSSNDFIRDYGDKLNKFGVLYRFRTNYSNFSFKKIIDPYFVSDKKIHFIFDSDIIWFKNQLEIEEEIFRGCQKSLMQDNIIPIYATFSDNSKIAEKLATMNAGMILYHKDNFDINKLEEFLQRLDSSNPRNLHFADQAGHAYCLKNLEALPADKYVIKDKISEPVVAKHYTGPRRPLFYIEGLEWLKKNGFFT